MRLYSAHPAIKKFFPLLVSGLFLIVSAACSENNPDANQVSVTLHHERAESYLSSGQFRAAVIEARNILQKAPESAVGYEMMAKINRELGVFQQTLDLLAEKPSEVEATTALLIEHANAFVNLGKTKSAKSIVQQLKTGTEEPGSIDIGLLEARIAMLEGASSIAASTYRSLLEQSPDNLDLLFDATEFYLYTEDFDTASELLTQAKIIEQDNPMRLFLLGLLEIQQDKFTAAELHLTEALDLRSSEDSMTPKKAAILTQLEKLMQATGRSVEAMAYREQLAEFYGTENNELSDKLERARELYARQEYVASRELLEGIVDSYPQFGTPNLMLATLDFRANDMENAALRFIEHIDLETHDDQLIEMTVISSLSAGKTDQLLALFKQSMAVEQDAELLNAQARLLSANNKVEEAIASAAKAVELEPLSVKHYVLLANIHMTMAKTDKAAVKKAIEVLQQGLDKNTNQGNSVDDESLLALSKLYIATLVADSEGKLENIDKARVYVNEQLKVSKESAAANDLAASFYVLTRDFSSAKDYANKSLQKNSDSKTMLYGLAAILRQLEESYKNVLEMHAKVVELEPQQPEGYIQMLGSARDQEEFNQAAEKVATLAEKHQSSTGFAVLSRAYLQQGDSEKADGYYQKAKALAENTTGSAEFERAIVQTRASEHAARGDFAAARKTLKKGLEEYGDSPALLSQLIELEIAVEKYSNGRALLPRLEELDLSMASLYEAELDLAEGNTDLALAKYRKLWSKTKTDMLAQRLYIALLEKGQQQADQFVGEWGKEIPGSIVQKQIASSLAIQSGDYDSAIESIEFLLQKNSRDVRSLNNLAWLYQQKGDDRAIDLAGRAYQLAPEQANVIDTYAWVLAENGQVEKAIPLFEKALELDPENKEILENLEDARSKL